MWLFALAGTAFAADDIITEASASFEVPSFSFEQLVVEGQDLLSIAGDQGGTSSIDGQLALIYTKATQTPSRTSTMGNGMATYFSTAGSHDMSVAAEEVFAITDTRYRGAPAGFFTSSRAAVGLGKVAADPALADMTIGGGVGYGRVVDVRTLAQAQAMFKVLDRTPTVEQLKAVAELIGQRGAYAKKYKYDADIHFYKDVGEALGGAATDEVYRVQQVLDSPLYNIGSRYDGWQVGFDLDAASGDLLDADNSGLTTRVGVGGAAAVMLGGNSLLVPVSVSCLLSDNATQVLTTPLAGQACMIDGELGFTLAVGGGLSMDHSASWNTTVQAGIEQSFMVYPDLYGTSIETFVGIESLAAVGSDLVWGNAFQAASTVSSDEDATLAWDFVSTITYYVF
jgi:hypothetical protein